MYQNRVKELFVSQTTNAKSPYFDLQHTLTIGGVQHLRHYVIQIIGTLGSALINVEMLDISKDEWIQLIKLDNSVQNIKNANFATDVLNDANWYSTADDSLSIGCYPNLGWRPGKYRLNLSNADLSTNITVYLIDDKI